MKQNTLRKGILITLIHFLKRFLRPCGFKLGQNRILDFLGSLGSCTLTMLRFLWRKTSFIFLMQLTQKTLSGIKGEGTQEYSLVALVPVILEFICQFNWLICSNIAIICLRLLLLNFLSTI